MEFVSIQLLILSLATWRLASLLASEPGPLDMFEHLRRWLGVRVDPNGRMYFTNTFAKGLTCIWCNSVWLGTAFAVMYYVQPMVAAWLLLPFALSASAVFYQLILKSLQSS